MDKISKMKELVELLNKAAKTYYSEDREIMPNLEYDRLYDELAALEEEIGVILSGSPTGRVGYEVMSELPKEEHASPMLSLDKTKDTSALKDWLGDRKGLLSWKLDGLTIALTYREGALYKAVTRGNGQVGEVITSNARVFTNLPLQIPFKGELVLRGEAVISYPDFEKINEGIEDLSQKYKNPRNLCSGSVRQLNNEVTAARKVGFYAFSLVSMAEFSHAAADQTQTAGTYGSDVPLAGQTQVHLNGDSAEQNADGLDFANSREEQLKFLAGQGFQTVEYFPVTGDDIETRIEWYSERVKSNDLPSDGLVLIFDDVKYSASLGSTSKFPKDSIAFKWEDEQMETTLREIEWSASRTGLINPIAVFDPVELEGTTVSRASVHNISIVEELRLGIGDRITVYKANMIIPQIADNLTGSANVEIPRDCPVCGGETEIKDESGVKFLYCTNEDCQAKKLKTFTHFVSRDAMNIDGLSEATLEKFVAGGFIHEAADLFRLERFKEDITGIEGFGKRSYNNLIAAVEKARNTTQVRLLYSLGVPGIGLSNAKLICKAFGHDWERIKRASEEELIAIAGIGGVMAAAFVKYFDNQENMAAADRLVAELVFEDVPPQGEEGGGTLDGLVFVITGGLEHYENRNALKDAIEAKGGKTTGSVTSKTDYLINNDVLSSSSKNKTAKSLGVPIIDENQIRLWIETGERPIN